MDTADLHPLHMVVGGDALAREPSGRVVFISGAIPGETVRVRFTTSKKDFAKAAVTDVLVASPDRVVPPCEAWHRGCGGCDWQHIAPAAQLRYKAAVVVEALTRTGRLTEPTVRAFGSVPPWSYRTTIRVATGPHGTGFRARGSHHVVPIRSCPVAHPAVDAELASTRVPGHSDEVSIRASVATGAHNRSDDGDRSAYIVERVHGHELRVSIASFFQSSPRAAELLVDAVRGALAGVDLRSARVIDAYGGIGLFAVTVATDAAHITVVESSVSACADARVNLADRLASGRAAVDETSVEEWSPVAADVVIADPARSGLDRAAAAVLAATAATVFVLVSCDTGSLARDVRLLAGLGYVHCATDVIDAFPNTSHIETVTRFERSDLTGG